MNILYRGQSGAVRISAHRQSWFQSNTLSITPQSKRDIESAIRSTDAGDHARWKDDYSTHRPGMALYDLIDAENVRSRTIAQAVDDRNIALAQELAKKDAPIKAINELLKLANLPITISVDANDSVMASRKGGAKYSVAELSDGERNALLIAAKVLTVPSASLLLIDEPERHLHRSIISPLLSHLFRFRPDCSFIVSTHEVMLPIDNPSTKTLLCRDCAQPAGPEGYTWDIDLVESGENFDEQLRKDIFGARRKLLFVEGCEHSMDKPLYSLLFPEVTIISKSGCREVINAVSGIRSAEDVQWIRAFGIVDNDRRTRDEIADLKARGIYTLPVYSVESLYYHPTIQAMVATRIAAVIGGDAAQMIATASRQSLGEVARQLQHLSERVAEKAIREEISKQLPGRPEIHSGAAINISVDVAARVSADRIDLQNLIQQSDITRIIQSYPIRESGAFAQIANALGFQGREQYEEAVRKLLLDTPSAVSAMRALFDTLYTDLNA